MTADVTMKTVKQYSIGRLTITEGLQNFGGKSFLVQDCHVCNPPKVITSGIGAKTFNSSSNLSQLKGCYPDEIKAMEEYLKNDF